MKRVTVAPALAGAFALCLLALSARAADDKAGSKDSDAQQAASSEAKPDADGFYSLFNGKDLTG